MYCERVALASSVFMFFGPVTWNGRKVEGVCVCVWVHARWRRELVGGHENGVCVHRLISSLDNTETTVILPKCLVQIPPPSSAAGTDCVDFSCCLGRLGKLFVVEVDIRPGGAVFNEHFN